MKLITVNAGSSSLRLSVFCKEGHPLRLVKAAHYVTEDVSDSDQFSHLLGRLDALDADVVIHRIVHGGERLTSTCKVDDQVEAEIERQIPIAPLHNKASLTLIRYCRELLGHDVTQLAVFDTAFYGRMPRVASTYALPQALCRRFGIRRYGFHGLAHRAMWSGWCALKPALSAGGKVITMQLGAGCSITAINRGTAIDTSMGFTPLEGLVMATRGGDVDPGLLIYLQRECQITLNELDRILNRESGLLGISGSSGDMRKLLDTDDPAALLAVDIFCYRIRKYLGAYLVILGGCDAILIGGGIGENSPAIRAKIFDRLEWLGIGLDETANQEINGQASTIHTPQSRCEIRVMPVDEAMVLAREALDFLNESG